MMEIEEDKSPKEKHHIDESKRWRIIGFLEAGKNQLDAANYFNVAQSSISRIGDKFANVGQVKDYARSGRIPKINTEKKEKMISHINENEFTSLREIGTQVSVSHTEVSRNLHELGFNYRFFKEIPKLTEKNMQDREAHCLKGMDQDFSKIIFSDESYFRGTRNTLGKGTAEKTIKKEMPGAKYSIMVGGGISLAGKTKLYIKPSKLGINQQVYIEILENFLLPFTDNAFNGGFFQFMQDNARAHIGQNSIKGMEDHVPFLMDHPPYSPDLNPIELIWKSMKDYVEKSMPQNSEELEKKILESWDMVSSETIQNCISHVKKRMRIVYENKGTFI